MKCFNSSIFWITICGLISISVSVSIQKKSDSYLSALQDVHPERHGYELHDSYGPPGPIYGAPAPHPPPIYGPPLHPIREFHDEKHWLLDKFKFKINFLTIGTMLIKLLILKKIIKFAIIIFLLLVVPKIHEAFGYDDEEEDEDDEPDSHCVDKDGCKGGKPEKARKFNPQYNYQIRIKEANQFVKTALRAFKEKQFDDEARSSYTDKFIERMHRMINVIDNAYPMQRVLRLCSPKLEKFVSSELNEVDRTKELVN